MEEKIRLGHPFYFPTQTVLVDDDPDFLDGISLMLNKQLSYRLFQSASDALKYVNEAHLHCDIVQRCYSSYKTGPFDSDSITHIDIGKLHHEVLNASRFMTCSTLIVDYSMPQMNGLEMLMNLKNPYIRKVLLTGQADMELAVKAFNHQLIDQFIDKHDPRLKQKLNATISSFEEQYFRRSFKLITDPIMANNVDAFLISAEFQKYFDELRRELRAVEYYLIDAPHSGFLLMDAEGQRHCLLVYTRQALDEHCHELMEAGAADSIIGDVRAGNLVPAFNTVGNPLSPKHPALAHPSTFYRKADKVCSASHTYFVAVTGAESLTFLQDKLIVPYGNFLESNALSQHIIH
jgi:FixJ family two-component response regulator